MSLNKLSSYNPSNANPQLQLKPTLFLADVQISTTATLTANQSGYMVGLTSAGTSYVVSLPAPIKGLKYKIVLVSTASTNTVTITATGPIIVGNVTGLSPNETINATSIVFSSN